MFRKGSETKEVESAHEVTEEISPVGTLDSRCCPSDWRFASSRFRRTRTSGAIASVTTGIGTILNGVGDLRNE